MSLAMTYFYLAIAIIAEVIATSALKASEGFSRLWPSVITVVGYSIAFWCLSLTLKVIPTGIVYAIWSGSGVALVTLAGHFFFKQVLDRAAIIGIGMIVSGVIVLQLFSSSVTH